MRRGSATMYVKSSKQGALGDLLRELEQLKHTVSQEYESNILETLKSMGLQAELVETPHSPHS